MPTKEYDLFISYADADRGWVEGYLLDALSQAGVRYHSEAAFALGAPRIAEFNRAIEQSDRILLVLSHAYLANNVNRFLDSLAQSYGRDKGIWPVIPLIRNETLELPPSLSALVPLNATNEEECEEAIERLCNDLQRPVPDSSSKPECPYPGMRPFSEENSDRFFGRAQEINQLLQQLRQHHFISVIGPSGSGKSSLVFAGLIPALRRSGLFGAGEWLIRTIRPGETPLSALETALGSDLANLASAVTIALATQANAQRLLLVVDQFEEVFTQAEQETIPFQEILLRLLEIPNCYVILTVRADFYPELMESILWHQIQISRLEVVPLNAEGLHEAITRPAENVNVFIESALVERLVADANGEPGVLPLVQETMVLLWEKVERRYLPLRAYDTLVLTKKTYENIDGSDRKGLQAVIANHADSTVIRLPEEQRQIVRRIFLRLIQFGEGRADTRRQQSVEQLRALGDNAELFDRTVSYLAENRLLTLSAGKDGSSINVDIAHEALIEGWPALQWWLQERREAEQTRRRLERQAQEWVHLGKGKGGLLDETELAEAKRWLSSSDAEELGCDETLLELIQASEQAIQEARQREYTLLQERLEQEKKASEQAEKARKQAEKAHKATQTRNRILIGAVIAVSTTTVGILIALKLATQREVTALAALSESRLSQNDQLGALIEGVRAVKQLKWWMPDNLRIKTIATLSQAYSEMQEFNRLEGHNEAVWDVSFSSLKCKKKIIATASDDTTVKLWNLDGSEQKVKPMEHTHRVSSVSFSPDCKTFASASVDGTVKLWKIDGTLIKPLPHKEIPVKSVSFSQDGQTIATGDSLGNIRLWRKDGNLCQRLPAHPTDINKVAFDPDGKFIASASSDTKVKLWKVDNCKINKSSPQEIIDHDGAVNWVSFSPDGKFIASASADKKVKFRKWDGKKTQPVINSDGQQLSSLEEHSESVNSVSFSSDSQFIASASGDGTVKLWRVGDQSAMMTLNGHRESVNSVSFSSDSQSQFIASASDDGTVKLWKLEGRKFTELTENSAGVYSVSVSPDGQKIASGHSDGTVKLWSLDGKKLKKRPHDHAINSVTFSPDGQMIAVGSNSGEITVWQLNGEIEYPVKLGRHSRSVQVLSFSPDGYFIISGSADGELRRWNIEDSKDTKTLEGHNNTINSLSFSGDGSILASVDNNKRIKLWTQKGEKLKKNLPVDFSVNSISLSPNGRLIALAGEDGRVELWNLEGTAKTILGKGTEKHKFNVRSVSFSPNGKIIATAGEDATVRLWSDSGILLKILEVSGREIESVSFSEDGNVLAAGSYDGTVIVWDLEQSRLVENSCGWLQEYLQTNPNAAEDRKLCPPDKQEEGKR